MKQPKDIYWIVILPISKDLAVVVQNLADYKKKGEITLFILMQRFIKMLTMISLTSMTERLQLLRTASK